jgi:hypothetical protein
LSVKLFWTVICPIEICSWSCSPNRGWNLDSGVYMLPKHFYINLSYTFEKILRATFKSSNHKYILNIFSKTLKIRCARKNSNSTFNVNRKFSDLFLYSFLSMHHVERLFFLNFNLHLRKWYLEKWRKWIFFLRKWNIAFFKHWRKYNTPNKSYLGEIVWIKSDVTSFYF